MLEHLKYLIQVSKRKHLKDCFDVITILYKHNNTNNIVTEYIYDRIKYLSSTTNLQYFIWNKGGKIPKIPNINNNNNKNNGDYYDYYDYNDNNKNNINQKEIWSSINYPTDCELLMSLFCKYMDDAMCPAIKFSEKHFFQISLYDIKNIEKLLYKKFKDIAIICVNDRINTIRRGITDNNKDKYHDIASSDSLPYYFIAFNKQKFENIIKKFTQQNVNENNNNNLNISSYIKKPKTFLNTNYDDDYYNNNSNNRNKYNKYNNKNNVGTWYPQPGKNNLFHVISLFALFIHRCCKDKLTEISLKDQGCTLLDPILR